MKRVCWWISLALLALAAPGYAQAPSGGMVGQSVRVAYWCSSPNTSGRTCYAAGPIASASDTTLHLRKQSEGTDVIIPQASIRQVWVKDGTEGHFWAGASVGLILGGVAGAGIGSTLEFCIMTCSPATGLGVVIGVPAGFLIGGVLGATVRSDRWRPLKSTDAGVKVVRTRGGVGLGLSIGF